MASPSMDAPLFSDLRGVTVRNTFLEFEDFIPGSLPESGFARQASEPAKPFNRQVSEQTTAGSGAAFEESATETEHGYSQLASYLSSALPVLAGDRRGDRAQAWAPEGASTALQAALEAAVTGPAAQAPPGQVAVLRFCPNCGAGAEPNHRFCPYCCYHLQACTSGGAGGGGAAVQPPPAGAEDAGGAAVAASVPNLLDYLRRFRYVEACAADTELARVLCLNYMQGSKAP
mmetsp:Transcript_126633/g.394236  ORF Transcript_126633/g.394236 Transcript_126633/m.394236 type:complete len:231 (+) Transcript_126633:46-738(+)